MNKEDFKEKNYEISLISIVRIFIGPVVKTAALLFGFLVVLGFIDSKYCLAAVDGPCVLVKSLFYVISNIPGAIFPMVMLVFIKFAQTKIKTLRHDDVETINKVSTSYKEQARMDWWKKVGVFLQVIASIAFGIFCFLVVVGG